jgi:CNT family concentrative nucleoside transporter
MEALSRGATQGLKLAANVAGMLVAFVAIIAMFNAILGVVGWSLQGVLGFIFKPLAWAMGVPWSEAGILGTLMGEKIVLTELIAYADLSKLNVGTDISPRTAIIASYALCGFANFASIGIQIGGLGGMAPERRKDFAKLGMKAMFGGALASWLTATIAGILI